VAAVNQFTEGFPLAGPRGRMRLRVVPVIGAAPGEAPDQREVILSCRADAQVRTVRRVPSGEQLDGPGLTSGPDRFAVEGVIGVERVKPGRIILTAGTVTSPHAEGEHGERVRFALRAENWDEFLVVCPGDMRLSTEFEVTAHRRFRSVEMESRADAGAGLGTSGGMLWSLDGADPAAWKCGHRRLPPLTRSMHRARDVDLTEDAGTGSKLLAASE
jgi:hypothetical protein